MYAFHILCLLYCILKQPHTNCPLFTSFYYYEYVQLLPLLSFETHALFTGGPLFLLCGVIHVCEKASLVSQTLNCALALIAANL